MTSGTGHRRHQTCGQGFWCGLRIHSGFGTVNILREDGWKVWAWREISVMEGEHFLV